MSPDALALTEREILVLSKPRPTLPLSVVLYRGRCCRFATTQAPRFAQLEMLSLDAAALPPGGPGEAALAAAVREGTLPALRQLCVTGGSCPAQVEKAIHDRGPPRQQRRPRAAHDT